MSQFWHFLKRSWRHLPCRSLIAAAVAATIGVAAGRTLVGRVSVVSGSSMSPNFEGGTWVHSTRISGSVERGDVVVLDDGSDDYALKRVVGLPGETVQIWHGYVFINHKILLEPYVPKRIYTFPRRRKAIFVLGPNEYFVLGDNRPCSADSRIYGPVERKQLKERVPLP